ncbi:hypothetical protein LEN26_001123 [Aphanomyces euteiches]|nr:hypothetical protein AeMF1_001259 [Aphanomyces euteiches]KAH9162034.1 hypothetical protein LEN26_001123 [Aphanomyces euteiches]KAH9189576.1 hypothetical protein AeNC1_008449 [Aphanomyces euteiches]
MWCVFWRENGRFHRFVHAEILALLEYRKMIEHRLQHVVCLLMALWAVSSATGDCYACRYRSASCDDSADDPVCNAFGQIQVDDVLCDQFGCSCAEGYSCVSLRLGGLGLVQGGGRSRCISEYGSKARFDAYHDALGSVTSDDWIYFREQTLSECKSDVCQAARQLNWLDSCNSVLFGDLVTASLDPDNNRAIFVVEGSLSNYSAGVFSISTAWDPYKRQISCDKLVIKRQEKQYWRQTRTSLSGECKDRYLDFSAPVSFADGVVEAVNRTSAIVWLVVFGLVSAATAAVVAVIHARRHFFNPHTVPTPQATQLIGSSELL